MSLNLKEIEAQHTPPNGKGVVAELIRALRETRTALSGMVDMMDKVWPAVDWGKTFNLPVREMNEAPIAARRVLASVEDAASSQEQSPPQ